MKIKINSTLRSVKKHFNIYFLIHRWYMTFKQVTLREWSKQRRCLRMLQQHESGCCCHDDCGQGVWEQTGGLIAHVSVAVALDGVSVLSAVVSIGGRVGSTGQGDLSTILQSETERQSHDVSQSVCILWPETIVNICITFLHLMIGWILTVWQTFQTLQSRDSRSHWKQQHWGMCTLHTLHFRNGW